MPDNKHTLLLNISMIIKYTVSAFIVLAGAVDYDFLSMTAGIFELFVIMLTTNFLFRLNKPFAVIWNCVAMIFVNAQFTILRFGGSFFSFIMLTNVSSISAINGKASIYITFGIIAVFAALLPVREFHIPAGKTLTFASLGIIVLLLLAGADEPVYSFVKLGKNIHQYEKRRSSITASLSEGENASRYMRFFNENIPDYFNKPGELTYSPNIILIFTEGLSQNIVDDERNIMPNVKNFENSSLNFTNYYNHTAATYRGIIGQLFSAHQFSNPDKNNLISIQSILKNTGYNTTFINSEPENEEFTTYLNNLGFDIVTHSDITDRFTTDKEMYDLLYDTVASADRTVPQFISLYTFGTHISMTSADKVYGDGSNSLLNRFYNVDYWFGNFMSRLEEAGLADDTVVIFTADHAAYCDEDYIDTFYPDYIRMDAFCDEIPLLIWYKGVVPATVDAMGRNSLGLAPTVLDFLDISDCNFFLGDSLFGYPESDEELLINTAFSVPDHDWCCRTYGDKVTSVPDDEKKILDEYIGDYLSFSMSFQAQ